VTRSVPIAAGPYLADGTDLLGASYERLRLSLPPDREGPVVATVVRRTAAPASTRSVLMIHGLADYFFQTHVADFLLAHGWNVYGIDLRKHGRSLLTHQTPNLCAQLADYYPELDAALDLIVDDGAETVLVWGHSTGGLIASLWAQERQTEGRLHGLFLNSPFFDFPLPWILRRPALAALAPLGRLAPRLAVPQKPATTFAEHAHSDWHGEWDYDLTLKPAVGYPIRLGWLAAVRSAQARLRRGLDLQIPVLIGCSERSYDARRDQPDQAARTDIVLNVTHIARWAPTLGKNVRLVRFEDAMHDLTLSRAPVRARVLAEVKAWTDGWAP